jgi:hypothetical protein
MISTRNLISDLRDVPREWVFENYLNLKEKLTGQDVKILSAFNSKGNDNKVEGLLKSYGLTREITKVEEPKKTPTFVIEQKQKTVQMSSKDKIKMNIINIINYN